MATYGGGLIFVNTKSSADLANNTTSVLYTVPAGDYYTEFKALSVSVTVNLSVPSEVSFYIESDNGQGSWVRQSTAFAPGVGAGLSTVGTSAYYGQETKIFPGQRIVAVHNGFGGTIRFVYSYNQFSPAS